MKPLDFLEENPAFTFRDNVFYQKALGDFHPFERLYLSIRVKEQRVYPDRIVKALPDFPPDSPMKKEWTVRRKTLTCMISYLRKAAKGKEIAILEVGCGNGWLSNHLARTEKSCVLGIDVNEKELLQAARVFRQRKNLRFAYADVFSAPIPAYHFDFIILSASLQYFRDIHILLQRLLTLLAQHGEIHIIDSPLYSREDLSAAARRSESYFVKNGVPLMQEYYFHHSYSVFNAFQTKILHDPATPLNWLRNKSGVGSPFPWIRITGVRM